MRPAEPYPLPSHARDRCFRVAEVLIQHPRITLREIERRTGLNSKLSLERLRARLLLDIEQGSGVRPNLYSLNRTGQVWFAVERSRQVRLDAPEPILQALEDGVQDG